MKFFANFLLIVFLAFLSTPTVVGMIEKSCDTSIFYTMSEEEETHKELKVVVESLHYSFIDISARVSSLIISENLSKHDNISAAIFIPPPDLI